MTQHTVAITLVREVLRGPRTQGMDVAGMLRRAGISGELLAADEARVSRTQCAALMRTVKRCMRDEFWGVSAGRLPPGTFAQLCRLVVHCPDLGTALRAGFDFLHLFLPDLRARVRLERDSAVLSVERRGQPIGGPYDFGVATILFEALQILHWLSGRRIEPRLVGYRCAQPPHVADSVRLMTPHLRFGQPDNRLVIDAAVLAMPVVRDAANVKPFLATAPAGLLLPYRVYARLCDLVRSHLRRHPLHALPSLEDCASSLALTPQTLRRRLRDEGTGFRTLVADLRRDAAIHLLARPDLSLQQIAGMVGFSESSTFHRAFKKSTGVAPGEYRRDRLATG